MVLEMIKKPSRKELRQRRHLRIKKGLVSHKAPEKPRLVVYKSLKHLYAQIIRDGKTLVFASTQEPELKAKVNGKKNVQAALELGRILGRRALEAGITEVVFDRSGYPYHGRVKAIAEAAREAGLKF